MNVDNFLLIGGHRMLLDLAKVIIDKNYNLNIIIDKFHLNMKINEKDSLIQKLEDESISYEVLSASRLTVKDLKNYVSKNTIGISISSPWILNSEIINFFNGKLLNIHTSNLPKNRGGGGFSWQIMMNDMKGGICIHKVDEGIDSGDIVMRLDFNYPSSCKKPADFIDYIEKYEKKIIRRFINNVKEWTTFPTMKQNHNDAEYWPRLNTKKHGFIDWSWKGFEIKQFIDAFDDPYEGASTFVNGLQLFLKKCEIMPSKKTFHPFQYGIIYHKTDSKIYVAAQKCSLIISCISDCDGENAFRKINLGDRLYTPQKYVEESFCKRVFYSANAKLNKF